MSASVLQPVIKVAAAAAPAIGERALLVIDEARRQGVAVTVRPDPQHACVVCAGPVGGARTLCARCAELARPHLRQRYLDGLQELRWQISHEPRNPLKPAK